MKKIIALIPFLFLIFACTDSELIIEGENVGDGSGTNDTNNPTIDCDNLNFTDQDAQGVFSGDNYTYTQAYYRLLGEGDNAEYTISILVNEPTGGTCYFPDYGGDANKRIIFSIPPTLEPETYDYQNTNIALNFNTTITNGVNAELATCWKFELVSHDADANKVYGKIVAEGVDGSTINGNVTLDLCENN